MYQKVVSMCVNSAAQRKQAVMLQDPSLRVRVMSDIMLPIHVTVFLILDKNVMLFHMFQTRYKFRLIETTQTDQNSGQKRTTTIETQKIVSCHVSLFLFRVCWLWRGYPQWSVLISTGETVAFVVLYLYKMWLLACWRVHGQVSLKVICT